MTNVSMERMFSEFSSGYYVGRLFVAPRDGDRAAMQTALHEQVNEQLYADEPLARLDAPLVMKLETHHFAVHGDENVPAGTLEVPAELLANTRISNPPSQAELLLAKADRAKQLLELTGNSDGPVGI